MKGRSVLYKGLGLVLGIVTNEDGELDLIFLFKTLFTSDITEILEVRRIPVPLTYIHQFHSLLCNTYLNVRYRTRRIDCVKDDIIYVQEGSLMKE